MGCLDARRLIAAAAAVSGVIATAACASASPPAAPATPAITACTGGSGLEAWIGVSRGAAAAGTTSYPLNFTNAGRSACSLSGYPVVAAISRTGSQLGSLAGRGLSTAAPRVVLAPGATAHTTLIYYGGQVSASPGCGPVATAAELRIEIGAQNQPSYAAFGFRACSRAGHVYLTVTQPVRAGVGTPARTDADRVS